MVTLSSKTETLMDGDQLGLMAEAGQVQHMWIRWPTGPILTQECVK